MKKKEALHGENLPRASRIYSTAIRECKLPPAASNTHAEESCNSRNKKTAVPLVTRQLHSFTKQPMVGDVTVTWTYTENSNDFSYATSGRK